jgi:hypothetical protein
MSFSYWIPENFYFLQIFEKCHYYINNISVHIDKRINTFIFHNNFWVLKFQGFILKR